MVKIYAYKGELDAPRPGPADRHQNQHQAAQPTTAI
jgi:hypothetical protein